MPDDSDGPRPPRALRHPTVLIAHGDARVDDWYWLNERDNHEVIAHLEAENVYTAAMTEHTSELQELLYKEIVARIQETDLSVPARKRPWLYYTRTEQGRQYGIHCRRCAGTGTPAVPPEEQILLDENETAGDAGYFALGGFSVSPDHSLLAYSTDTTGGERYTLRFRDLQSGRDLEDVVEDTYYGLAWASDNARVFYTRPDDAMRPHQLWRHTLGEPEDTCVYEEPDEHFYVGVARTKDDAYVLMTLHSSVTTEVHGLRADDPEGTLQVMEPRRQGIEYSAVHYGANFYIVTNDQAENFRLVEAPDSEPGRIRWRDVVPHDREVRLEGADVLGGHLVLYERAEGSPRVRVMRLTDGDTHVVPQPESVSTSWPGQNLEVDSTVLRYEYTSLVTPRSVYDYDLSSRERTLLKRQPVLGDFDPSLYRTERLWANCDDETRVPVSVVYREGLVRDGQAPCLLYGYGSYEASTDPTFSSLRLSLLDRGFVFAIVHVRGGGEMGRRWYTEGKLSAKPNTFRDFILCARHLVDESWTSTDRLVARGGSAGGLLMGAVANMAPTMFRAIVAEVPFVDCLTTILDDSLPLTVIEWEEWGNPKEDRSAYEWIKSYSPYDNLVHQRYPDILATAGINDPRVSYWEPAKWAAKLREVSPESRVLLKTELGAGHQGPSGRYDAWRDEAFILAFVLDAVGIRG